MYHHRLGNTIAALATSPGSSIGIIRISGFLSFQIASKITGLNHFDHMKARLVKIVSEKSTVLEKCIILPFKKPNSFTGEDVVEFHVHGSSLNAFEILSLVISLGASPALRGEFTFRAVLNSKLNLPEAFALNTLISSQNPYVVELSRKESFENKSIIQLRNFLAEWENFFIISTAIIDFPDQVSESLPVEEIRVSIKNLKSCLNKIVKNSHSLKKLVNFSVLIMGKPNVGKSSLFNLLLNKQRAITSEVPGTTRDYLSESVFLKGFQINLIDSAGIHKSNSDIENQGIQKTINLIESSDLIILVLDSTQPLNPNDLKLIDDTIHKPRIIVENKIDAPSYISIFENSVKISCLNGNGLADLFDSIEYHINLIKPDPNISVFFNDWQVSTAEDILRSLDDLTLYFESDQIEIILFNIKNIFYNLRNLTGEISAIDIYDNIFSSFCFGK